MKTENDYLENISLSLKFCHCITKNGNWSEDKIKVHYTFWCILDGALTLSVNERTFQVSAGDVVFFYPGCRYQAHTNGIKTTMLFVCFDLETGNHIDLLEGNDYAGVYHNADIAAAAERFYTINSQYSKNLITVNFQQYMAFWNFFSIVTSHLGHQESFMLTPTISSNPKIRKILNYIHEYHLEPLTNAEMAAYMDMSEKYFIRFFRTHLGYSPHQYLREYQMRHSLVYLSDPEYSLADIAQKFNFADEFTFSKAFKRIYGESPNSIRKKLS